MRGAGVYVEAKGRRHEVDLTVAPDGLGIIAREGANRAFWAARDIRLANVLGNVTRLSHAPNDTPTGEIVELTDAALVGAVGRMALDLGKRHDQTPAALAKLVAMILGGVALLILVLIWLVPPLAGALTPIVPIGAERSLGELVEGQLRATLRPRASESDFHCRGRHPAGDQALARMTARLVAAGTFAVPPRVAVIDVPIPNAVALPGGQVFLMRGLIERARSAEEVAGVLAHEFGHVHHRHGMRRLLEAGTLAMVLAVAVGDLTGGVILTNAAAELMTAGYSRNAEREADLFTVDLLTRLGVDPSGLGALLGRIATQAGEARSPLASHPFTPDRVAAIEERLAGRRPTGAILSQEEWRALAGICGGTR